jgi:hypothetical protein
MYEGGVLCTAASRWRVSAGAVVRLLALAAVVLPVSTAHAGPLPAPGGDGWTALKLPRIQRQTRYESIALDGAPALRATADCSASAMYLALSGVDLDATPILSWRWRVERAIDNPEERTRGADDFAARVYVTFRFDPALASFTERMKHRIARAVFGDWVWGRALVYVWSSTAPAGTSWSNPRGDGSQIVSLGPAPAGEWRAAQVDVAADFARFFGTRRPALQAVAVMADTDQTCSRATAAFADFRFEPYPAAPTPAPSQVTKRP